MLKTFVMSNSSDAVRAVCLEMCECKIKCFLGFHILLKKIASAQCCVNTDFRDWLLVTCISSYFTRSICVHKHASMCWQVDLALFRAMANCSQSKLTRLMLGLVPSQGSMHAGNGEKLFLKLHTSTPAVLFAINLFLVHKSKTRGGCNISVSALALVP